MIIKLAKNFNVHEFDCKDKEGTKVPEELYVNRQTLANQLQVIRDAIDEPLHINSAYRTKSHNKAVGGKKNSYHLRCMAADITAKNFTAGELGDLIQDLMEKGEIMKGGVGVYKGFIHYDIRGYETQW